MKRFVRAVITPAAVAILTASQCHDVLAEPLTGTKLVEACKAHLSDQQSTGASSCQAFIYGYLSASKDIVAAEDRPSSFVTRAIRTRASRLSDDAEQRLSSRYCLPESESMETLIEKVASVEQPLAEDATADSVMLAVFENHFRCKDVLN